MTRKPLFVYLCLVGCACGPPVIDDGDVLALVGGTVITGLEAPPIPEAVVLIRDGEIIQVSPSEEVRLGPSISQVDVSDSWIVPGFVEAHGHILNPERDLRTFLDFGVTAVRSPVSLASTSVPLRDEIEAGVRPGPRMRVAGTLIDSPHEGVDGWWATAATPDEARSEVARQAELGVDFVKLYDDLSPEIVAASIDEAHGRGIRVIGHLGRTTWQEATEAGIDALTHSWFASLPASLVPAENRERFVDFHPNSHEFDPTDLSEWLTSVEDSDAEARALAQVLARAEVVVDPTLVLVEAALVGDSTVWASHRLASDTAAYAPHPMTAAWLEDLSNEASRAFEVILRTVRIFHEEGVLLTAGSDTPNPWMNPGVSLHREFELLVRAGIPPEAVIRIATFNGARAMGIEDEIGSIEAGKRADLVILEEDPLSSISATRAIRAVYRDGIAVRQD